MPRILAISPHLDDAVLSAGARLSELVAAGDEVTVHTLFAGRAAPPYSPVARRLHALWALSSTPVEIRRDEDLAAHGELGTIARHGDFPDSIYRRRDDGAWLIDDEPMHHWQDDEPELEDLLVDAIRRLISDVRPDSVLTCAALGDHVDHRRARDAVLRAVPGTGTRLQLWEDLPYGLWAADSDERKLPVLPVAAAPAALPSQPAAWDAKYRAIACYRSQQRMLWDDEPDFRARLDAYAVAQGLAHGTPGRVELFWDIEPPTARREEGTPA